MATVLASSSCASHGTHKVKFTPIEDIILKELVAFFGDDWNSIARQMPNRTIRQCRERWLYFLAPSVINGPWSLDEDTLLLEKFGEFGSKWKNLTQFFPGRTEVNIKNHHATLLRRRVTFNSFRSTNDSPEVGASRSTPLADNPPNSRGFFDNLFAELPTLLWDFQTKEESSSSSSKEEDMENGFELRFF
jgi:hypothetical protein